MGGGSAGGGGAAAGGGAKGFSANKDQLYERLIMEKDQLSRLKLQLAMSGQQVPDDGGTGNPMEQAIQQQMMGAMQQQQQQGQMDQAAQAMDQGNPYAGISGGGGTAGQMPNMTQDQSNPMQVQASFKEEVEDVLEKYAGLYKESVAPLAALGALSTAHTATSAGAGIARLGVGAAGAARRGAENLRVANNPFLAAETKIKQDRRKYSNPTPDAWVGGLGYMRSNRQLNFDPA
jgi:hypothetical protein